MPSKTHNPLSDPRRPSGRRQARELAVDDQALLRAATKEDFARVMLLLNACYTDFNPDQQRRIREAVDAKPLSHAPKHFGVKTKPKRLDQEATPRFWLPFSGDTWSGRGRPPKAFIAWEGTVARTVTGRSTIRTSAFPPTQSDPSFGQMSTTYPDPTRLLARERSRAPILCR